jgi:hypothetical protein
LKPHNHAPTHPAAAHRVRLHISSHLTSPHPSARVNTGATGTRIESRISSPSPSPSPGTLTTHSASHPLTHSLTQCTQSPIQHSSAQPSTACACRGGTRRRHEVYGRRWSCCCCRCRCCDALELSRCDRNGHGRGYIRMDERSEVE